MCSIPGLPTPGSDVPVLITRVNVNSTFGLVELWVNIDDGRKHVYEEMREEIQTSERKFFGSEGKAGDLCLVCITDTWHRARIVSTQGETYNVFLIDQGQPHTTTSKALVWGQSNSFLLPPETESCILANIHFLENNCPEKATKLLESLPGKTFKGLVQHVLMPDRIIILDIPIVSKHLYKFEVVKKLPIDDFKCLVQKCLESERITQEQNLNVGCQLEKHNQYLCPELLTKTFETVYVTEVTNPNTIFCKLLIFSKAVKILSQQIQQHYEESSGLGEMPPLNSGDPCAAKGVNGRWYRSLLKQTMTSNGTVEVLHVDEGKIELVPVGDIRTLHEKFLRMPVVTYHCTLEGIKDNGNGWTTDETDYLKSLLLNQTVVAKFNYHNIIQDVYSVFLYADNAACINTCFIEKARPFSPSKTEQGLIVQNEPIPSSVLRSLGDEHCMDLQKKVIVNVSGSEEATLTHTKNLALNGRTDDLSTSETDDTPSKERGEHPDPFIQINGHHSKNFPSEAQNAFDDDFSVGSIVNVKVSFIEGPQKFWCQELEKEDSLRLLMQDLQNHYASAHPQPIVESICVARNPGNDMWYRAKIIASHLSPVVDVRFIDYGQTRTVALRDVRPIDPSFLRLNAQAFQCCLFSGNNSTNSPAITQTDAAEFQKFVDLGAFSNTGLKCIVKAVTSDEDGVPLNMVDIETPSDDACKVLFQKGAQPEARIQISEQVPTDVYSYSTHNIEVGGKEAVWVTSSENVNHFYCQLDRNSCFFDKVMENIKQWICQPKTTDHSIEIKSICLARYTDNQWYRGQVEEMSPKLKVQFVDFGEILAVSESDIYPFPTGANLAKSVPVQAVPLGLFDVPAEAPQGVNQWFADHAVGQGFTISVIAKEAKGKLIVELFEGSLNVNKIVREKILKMIQQGRNNLINQTEQQLSKSSEHANMANEDCFTQKLINTSVLTNMSEQNKVHTNNETSARDGWSSQSSTIDSAETVHENIFEEGRKPNLDIIHIDKEMEDSHYNSGSTQLSIPSCPEGNVDICMYKWPNIFQNKTEEVYTSCIVGPQYFWCQFTNTEDMEMVSRLAQESGQAQHDRMSPETLGPGSPCLALFSSDKQWYRAQVIGRVDDVFNVLFIDYGNESNVDGKNIRSLPQSLLEKTPLAFLCFLNGFDESQGSWDDSVYDDFHNLLVDKPLRATMFNTKDHPEIAVPQYAVEIECDGVVVNIAMQKYWKSIAQDHVSVEPPHTETLLQNGQAQPNLTNLAVTKENGNTCMYKEPCISINKKEEVYASCIVEPHYFWCQYANTEELSKITRLAQEAGQAEYDMMSPETLGPGSPCLALFSSDNQWYRAQVIRIVDDAFNVLFIDYGNEINVDIKNMRSLPQCLLENAPQAFLCSLNGFDNSKGSWIDEVYDAFYNLLVDKPLRVTVLNKDDLSESTIPQYVVEIECNGVVVNAAMQKYWQSSAKECVLIEHPQTETFPQDGQKQSNMIHLTVSKGSVDTCMYKEPCFSKNKKEEVYASCIVTPNFFWCQYANTEEISKVTRLAQEAGQVQCDVMFPETLGQGSPCLALFSMDNQWYRAQVLGRVDNTLSVLFIDYGNESDVDIKNVRLLPQSLLERTPQAFLCSLNGFDKSRGTWNETVYDDFYNLLVDKPLRVTVLKTEDESESPVPQYAVEIECKGVVVNTLMEKYWKRLDTGDASAEENQEIVESWGLKSSKKATE